VIDFREGGFVNEHFCFFVLRFSAIG